MPELFDRPTQMFTQPSPIRTTPITESRDSAILGSMLGVAVNDLSHNIRSEWGEDGPESYFESYFNLIRTGLVNIFANKIFVNSFILGSDASAGLLGSFSMGSLTGSESRVLELQSIQEFTEEFANTTYRDSLTTAAWSTTGSLVFSTSGSVAVISNWKDTDYLSTTFNRVRIDINFGSFGSPTIFEASFNGGSDYTQIFPSVEKIISSTGSDFRLRITDTSGSTVLRSVDVVTKGTNFG